MKNRTPIYTVILLGVMIFAAGVYLLQAAVTSATLTVIDAPTVLSNGKSYFLAGMQYRFRVQAVDPAATGAAYWDTIVLEFREGAVTRANCTIDIAAANATVQNGVVATAVDNTAVYTNLDFEITITPRWDATAYNAAAANNVRVTVSEDGASSQTDTVALNHGLVSEMHVLNFVQDNDGSDGRITPWHGAFNVTGKICYFVTGEGITTAINPTDPGEIAAVTDVELFIDGGAVGGGVANTGTAEDAQFSLAGSHFFTNEGGDPGSRGDHTWDMRISPITAGGPVTSNNTLAVNCNKVEITNVEFIGGGGIDAPDYYRSVNLPGTQIRLTARLEDNSPSLGGDRSMRGNTTLQVTNTTNAANFNVLIASGATQGTSVVTTPIPADFAVGNTQQTNYTITAISGSAYDAGQSAVGRITQPAGGTDVYFDNTDPPGVNGGDFTAIVAPLSTADSITLTWTALTAAGPEFDGDFYTYRIYYKRSADVIWKVLDRTVNDYGLNGGADTYRLDLIGTTTASIVGLEPLTDYDYQLSAIDVFGNEVAGPATGGDRVPDPPGTFATTASSVTVEISDGVHEYDDASFNVDADPDGVHDVFDTNIRVTANIVSGGNVPDAVSLILVDNDTDVAGDFGSGAEDDITTAVTQYEIPFSKITNNQWTAYIPDSNPLMDASGAPTSSIRFIIKTTYGAAVSYVDHNSEADVVPPGNWTDHEWRLHVVASPTFTPWPTRVLNNVISKDNPVAYPAYYLSDDAKVTIRVYDVKGRVVATLLEDATRKGGQNIKDQGWRGTNKDRRKLGVGLYYMHFYAERASDGKVILDDFKKVVIKD